MNLRMTVGFALCVASLMGCPTTESGTDAGPRTDAFVAATDAPVVATDAPVVATDAPSPDAPVPVVTFATVHASLQASCGPCHAGGGAGGHNIAAADEMAAFTDAVRVGSSAALRVRNGTMPAGGPLPEPARTNLANLLDQWIAGGRMR
jgi:hypothetical protein